MCWVSLRKGGSYTGGDFWVWDDPGKLSVSQKDYVRGGKEENQEVIIENIDVYIKLKADIIKEVMNRIGNFYLEKCFNANNSENC